MDTAIRLMTRLSAEVGRVGTITGRSCSFFFNDTATTEIYTLSLHDALPISMRRVSSGPGRPQRKNAYSCSCSRSEEHTSELQSRSDLVCRLLLEKNQEHQRQLALQSLSYSPARSINISHHIGHRLGATTHHA